MRILHFSGDTDGAVPTLGTRKWIEEMGWPLKKEFRTWLMHDQVAGFIEEFEGLTLAIVHGVGHMAPQWGHVTAVKVTSHPYSFPCIALSNDSSAGR